VCLFSVGVGVVGIGVPRYLVPIIGMLFSFDNVFHTIATAHSSKSSSQYTRQQVLLRDKIRYLDHFECPRSFV
jgi:hypothetical protein